MGKHAYLIIDNGKNFKQLQLLINCIDDYRNDVYIHIDKKYKLDIPTLNVSHCNLYILKSRLSVNWGGLSMVKCELLLLKSAQNKANYDYYHLLSSQDLPLHNQNYIHNFFDSNMGKEFVSFDNERLFIDKIRNRYKHYHINTEYSFKSSKNIFSSVFIRGYRKVENIVQSLLCIDREKHSNFKYYYGSQWFSIDNELVNFILENEKNILSCLKFTNISDELFVQTIIGNNQYFKNKLYKFNRKTYLYSNLRYINWDLGLPYTWENKNFEILHKAMKEGFIFSRKFDINLDKKIVKRILANDGVE